MTYQFLDVSVDLERVAVTRNGVAVELEPKVFDVLRHLLEHADRLVTKEELLDAVWSDTFVTPNVLTRAIAQLRRALGDDAREARCIGTVARRGYRFIAELTVTSGAAPPDIRRQPPMPLNRPQARGRLLVIAAVALFAVAAGGAAFNLHRSSRRTSAPIRPGAFAPGHTWRHQHHPRTLARWPRRRIRLGSLGQNGDLRRRDRTGQ